MCSPLSKLKRLLPRYSLLSSCGLVESELMEGESPNIYYEQVQNFTPKHEQPYVALSGMDDRINEFLITISHVHLQLGRPVIWKTPLHAICRSVLMPLCCELYIWLRGSRCTITLQDVVFHYAPNPNSVQCWPAHSHSCVAMFIYALLVMIIIVMPIDWLTILKMTFLS